MAIYKCKMCGGDLDITEGMSTAKCEYCGTTQTVPRADNAKKLTLFGRASRLLRACEFDKAEAVYESIVADFPEEAEAYWGLVLCTYGIEYVDDPATAQKIPTCHRSSFDSVLDDLNYEQAMENTDAAGRKIYREEAKAIEQLRQQIIEVSSRETAYDIFICYKEADEDGNRTIDSILAQDIYDALTEKGYRVFFSRISLEDKLGQEYEPYIFAALNSARVMLVVGTDYEYFHAVWVKNEWNRFLKLIAAGKKKTLIPCFKGIDAYDMPKEFVKLQAQDLGKVGAVQDLLRGIDKIFDNSPSAQTDRLESQIQAQALSQADNTVQLGIMALNGGDTDKGIRYFEEAIKIDVNHVGAYLGLVRAIKDNRNVPYCKKLKRFPLEEVSAYLHENPEMLENTETSLLENALHNGFSLDFIQLLIDARAVPDTPFCLAYAIEHEKRCELTKLLLEHGADPNLQYHWENRIRHTETSVPLQDVILKVPSTDEQSELLSLLIKYGADVNFVSKKEKIPSVLKEEIGDGYLESLEYLSNSLRFKEAECSILDLAIRKCQFPIIKLLLQNGADVNFISRGKGWDKHQNAEWSMLDLAIRRADQSIIELLLQNGVDVNFVSKETRTNNETVDKYSMLDLAIRKGEPSIVELLLQNGADPNTGRDYTYKYKYESKKDVSYTCLSETIRSAKDRDMVQLLLNYGADPNYLYNDYTRYGSSDYTIKNISSLADVILYNPDVEMMRILLAAGADPNAVYISDHYTDSVSDVPVLYLAFMKANEELIRLLLDAGASLDSPVTSHTKKFPLKYAGLPADDNVIKTARKFGWKGPSFFRGGEVTVYTKEIS